MLSSSEGYNVANMRARSRCKSQIPEIIPLEMGLFGVSGLGRVVSAAFPMDGLCYLLVLGF